MTRTRALSRPTLRPNPNPDPDPPTLTPTHALNQASTLAERRYRCDYNQKQVDRFQPAGAILASATDHWRRLALARIIQLTGALHLGWGELNEPPENRNKITALFFVGCAAVEAATPLGQQAGSAAQQLRTRASGFWEWWLSYAEGKLMPPPESTGDM